MANDDTERARCVRSDAARKRAALLYTRWGRLPPLSLLRRETEEYGRARGHLFSDTGSSSLTPMKRGLEERRAGGVVVPEAEAGPERRAGGIISAREAEEDRQRRRRDEDINAVLYEQGVASALAFGDKVEEWRREAAEQERIYVDLTSSDDED